MRLIKQLKDLQDDYILYMVENRSVKQNFFEQSRELEKYKDLEKTLKEGKSVINFLQIIPTTEYYTFLFDLIKNDDNKFKLQAIIRSIQNNHKSIFFFFVKNILTENTHKFEDSPLKTLIESLIIKPTKEQTTINGH